MNDPRTKSLSICNPNIKYNSLGKKETEKEGRRERRERKRGRTEKLYSGAVQLAIKPKKKKKKVERERGGEREGSWGNLDRWIERRGSMAVNDCNVIFKEAPFLWTGRNREALPHLTS